MRLFKKLVLFTLCFLPCTLLFYGCKDEETPPTTPQTPVTVSSISVELTNENYTLSDPTDDTVNGTISVTYGEFIELTTEDFSVAAIYSDSTTKTLNSSEYEFESDIPLFGATPVGNYKLKFTYSDLSPVKISVIVNPLELSTENIKWNYSSPFTYDGTNHSVELINVPDTLEVHYFETIHKDAGNYLAGATLTPKNMNHVVKKDYFTLDWKIEKAHATITALDASISYGESISNSGYTYNGFINGETPTTVLTTPISYEYKNYTTSSNVGVYDIILTGDNNTTNYDITYINGKLTVNKAIVDTSSINATNIQLEATVRDYSGSPITVALKSFPLPNGVKLLSFTNNTATEAGTYTAQATYDCSDTTNYVDFTAITIELAWEIKAPAQPVTTTLPADLEIAISSYTIGTSEFIDNGDYFIVQFNDLSSDMILSGESNCNIVLSTTEEIEATDEMGNNVPTDSETTVSYSYQSDISADAIKLTITYNSTDFVIFVVFSDTEINI